MTQVSAICNSLLLFVVLVAWSGRLSVPTPLPCEVKRLNESRMLMKLFFES